MKILVIDDSPLHQQSARQTLVGHDLKVVGTYDEAHELLQERRADYSLVMAKLELHGFKSPYDQGATEGERAAARAEQRRLKKELCPPQLFDVVLSDLLMPASKMTMAEKGLQYVGQEMPVGFALSLMAAIQGAKYVAVVTATNHHHHPASAMLDPFASRCPNECDRVGMPPRFVINEARVGYYHSPMTPVEGTTCTDCNGTGSKDVCYCVERNAGVPKPGCDDCSGLGRSCWTCRNSGKRCGKDWGKVLIHLLNG